MSWSEHYRVHKLSILFDAKAQPSEWLLMTKCFSKSTWILLTAKSLVLFFLPSKTIEI